MRKHTKRKQRAVGLPLIFGLSQSMKTDLQLTPLGTLEGFREGTGTEEGAHTLAAAVNLAAVMSRDQPEEVQAVANAGLDAIVGVFKRGSETGRWGCSGDQYKAIGEALAIGADMADATTRRNVAKAIKTVFKEAVL